MKTNHWATLVLFLAFSVCSAVSASAASGTLKGIFAYRDPGTGVEQLLNSSFIYLRDATKPPPMEKFPSKADYILGPTSNGIFSLSVPEGSYYIRILRRKVVGNVARPYGPPEEGDFTWFQSTPIRITAGATLDLGKKYAAPFSVSPVTITGTVKTGSGAPLQGHYVRAQTEPCLAPLNCTDSGNCEQYGNECGEVKHLALRKTDANGSYTILLADPGTYYIYSSPCLMPGHNLEQGFQRCEYNAAPAPVTVIRGDRKTVDIVVD